VEGQRLLLQEEATVQNTISEKDNNTKHSDIRYNQDPDFNIPLLEISAEARERILGRLRFLYGELIDLDKDYDPTNRFSEKDNILITYGDLVSGEGHSPLAVLGEFLKRTPPTWGPGRKLTKCKGIIGSCLMVFLTTSHQRALRFKPSWKGTHYMRTLSPLIPLQMP
jgi:hypothetical protein